MADVPSRVVFEPEFRVAEAVRGLDQFEYIWLIWQFHQAERDDWSPTVRPPRLGGNERVGVFATRSPFRPNAIGLSAVKLNKVVIDKKLGPVLDVSGADLVDGTPIFDIKPYLPYADCHPEARSGFAPQGADRRLEVVFNAETLRQLPDNLHEPLRQALANDPRPRYHDDPDRVYGLRFGGCDVRFKVSGTIVTVLEINK